MEFRDHENELEEVFVEVLSAAQLSNAKLHASFLTASFLEDFDFTNASEWTQDAWRQHVVSWLEGTSEDVFNALETCEQHKLADRLRKEYSSQIKVGDSVLAVLEQDGEWHEAEVIELPSPTEPRYRVRFCQFGNPQYCAKMDLIKQKEEEAEEQEGVCPICERELGLTFHHLIPRETHSKMLKNNKVLVPASVESMYQFYIDQVVNTLTRKEWLNTYGVFICRSCHSQVHRTEPNDVLAIKYNTIETIVKHPAIMKWAKWANQQKV